MLSLSAWPWARVACFWLAFCFSLVQVPVIAQSTNSGPAPSAPGLNESWPLTKVSRELLATLKDLQAKYPKLVEESESLREQVRSLSDQVSALSSSSENWESESKRLSASVNSLILDFESYKVAVDKKTEIDNQAVEGARQERDEARAWNMWAWIGGAILGGLAGIGLAAIF